MADIITLGDVSTKDAGSGSELKTGGRRKHNMPKACVKMKMKEGMSRSAAVKACYPKGKPSGFPAGSQAETERKARGHKRLVKKMGKHLGRRASKGY